MELSAVKAKWSNCGGSIKLRKEIRKLENSIKNENKQSEEQEDNPWANIDSNE